MFSSIFSFEVKRLLKTFSTYIYFTILFAIAFFIALIVGGAFKSANVNMAGEKIMANSPLLIDGLFAQIDGWIGAIIVVAVIGNAVLKDFRYNTHNIIFSTPVNKFSYLFGRFSGASFVCMLILTGPAFGMMLAYVSPWVSADKVGAFHLMPYVQAYFQSVVPNLLLQGAIFFAVSLIARDIFIIWLSLIIYWVTIGFASAFVGSLQYETMAALLDPMGDQAKEVISKHWSTYDKNNLSYQLTGVLLWNRLLWLGVAALVFISGYLSFSFTSSARRISFRKSGVQEKSPTNPNAFVKISFAQDKLPQASRSFTAATNLKNLWGLAVNECRTILRNVYFRIIILFGMLFLFIVSFQLGKAIYDTATYPVTYQVVEYFGSTFQLFIVILTIFFSGEIVWRNRENRMDNILDALPVPNWVFYVSKLSGLIFMQCILIALIMVCGMTVQLFKGYFNFEPLLYIKYLFGFRLISFWILAVLCVFVQTLVRNKYIGYFIVVLFYVWNTFFASTVLKHNLFVLNSSAGVAYSDMNGFGHTVFPFIIFKTYWAAFGLILAALSSLLWARGTEATLSWRLSQASKSAKQRSFLLITVAAIIFIGCGSFIYYNTNVLNKHMSGYDQGELQADFEKKYKKFEHSAQPKITDVVVKVDIFPMERNLHASGTYVLQNKTGKAIDSLHILIPDEIKVNLLTFSKGAQMQMNDTTFGYRIYKLAQPLAAGDTVTLAFNVDKISRGFPHDFTGLSSPVYNGTFMNNTSFMPSIGYNNGYELSDNTERKKHGLGYRATENPITDTAEYNTNGFFKDADFVTFDATVSTSADQTAIAPGYLQKEWTENGRRYFHYKMDSKIMNFYSFLSARYELKKEVFNGINLEIYYHKGHEYNLQRMLNGMKKALSYYTTHFSPYQHKQVRILEFPRYGTFAQSFPNTIPFSEGIGFIANIDDSSKEDIDYTFYVTAHEVAHQWFAHQVMGANVEGSNMLSETLAQYGAITVMEKQYGEERLKKFLRIEMDKYLTARSAESEKEKTLSLVDGGQQYILYQKGGIIMTSLRKYIGEDSINKGLRNFINKYGFKAPPYPTTLDFLACMRAVTPDSMQYMITDGFEKIIIYDNKITDATATKNGDQYITNVTVDIKKLSAAGDGKETPISCNDYIDIAVYKDKNTVLSTTRYKLKDGITKLSIPTSTKPYKVVLDPHVLLIDKKNDDNEKRLEITGTTAKK